MEVLFSDSEFRIYTYIYTGFFAIRIKFWKMVGSFPLKFCCSFCDGNIFLLEGWFCWVDLLGSLVLFGYSVTYKCWIGFGKVFLYGWLYKYRVWN
ncbi:hypothetical protein M6B38_366870 [Iris pallida]|uniref:Uncharacterized protein n=1 Tax=Iris pallida TaxID=29817 RepID=A0AAX6GHD5_IRIPA|nr:hypothetical protein M6B38_366865 [Iris pallida]KAJ6827602.1 hypothetical protein M6B38_366870 [Iris pallida]